MPSELRVSVAGPHDGPEWDGFVSAQGDDTGYHAWDWQRVFANAFGHEPVYLIARRSKSRGLCRSSRSRAGCSAIH